MKVRIVRNDWRTVSMSYGQQRLIKHGTVGKSVGMQRNGNHLVNVKGELFIVKANDIEVIGGRRNKYLSSVKRKDKKNK